MQYNPELLWKLRVENPDNINWQTQYTGFDPCLDLPAELTEEDAREFLLSYARFEDGVRTLNNVQNNDRLNAPNRLLQKFLETEKKSRVSNSLEGILKRASFNTNVLGFSSNGYRLDIIREYLFSECGHLKPMLAEALPDTSPRKIGDKTSKWGGTKAERKALRSKLQKIRMPYQRIEGETIYKDEPCESVVNRFLQHCDAYSDISCRGYLDYCAQRIKPQYVEPWLLYHGQVIGELKDQCELLDAPDHLKEHVAALQQVYNDSGFERASNRMRELASTPEALSEKRIIVPKPFPNVSVITRVGGLHHKDGPIIHITPESVAGIRR